MYPAAHLRNVAEVAVAASTAAGFAGLVRRAGGAVIVRRTIARFHRPVGRDAVARYAPAADFRRGARDAATRSGDDPRRRSRERLGVVDVASGRPRRIPDEVERTFDAPRGAASTPRVPWDETLPPVTPCTTPAALRFTDLDSLGHVNNAAYLDVLTEAALAPLARAGWGVDRLGAAGLAPFVASCDVEYLDAVVWGDPLTITTWMTPLPRGRGRTAPDAPPAAARCGPARGGSGTPRRAAAPSKRRTISRGLETLAAA
jgi:YbgC/YbaW family acyl-CoA thioester hydrolase